MEIRPTTRAPSVASVARNSEVGHLGKVGRNSDSGHSCERGRIWKSGLRRGQEEQCYEQDRSNERSEASCPFQRDSSGFTTFSRPKREKSRSQESNSVTPLCRQIAAMRASCISGPVAWAVSATSRKRSK